MLDHATQGQDLRVTLPKLADLLHHLQVPQLGRMKHVSLRDQVLGPERSAGLDFVVYQRSQVSASHRLPRRLIIHETAEFAQKLLHQPHVSYSSRCLHSLPRFVALLELQSA
jgi:hypothetical protein